MDPPTQSVRWAQPGSRLTRHLTSQWLGSLSSAESPVHSCPGSIVSAITCPRRQLHSLLCLPPRIGPPRALQAPLRPPLLPCHHNPGASSSSAPATPTGSPAPASFPTQRQRDFLSHFCPVPHCCSWTTTSSSPWPVMTPCAVPASGLWPCRCLTLWRALCATPSCLKTFTRAGQPSVCGLLGY